MTAKNTKIPKAWPKFKKEFRKSLNQTVDEQQGAIDEDNEFFDPDDEM